MAPPDPVPGYVEGLLIRRDGEYFRVQVPDPPPPTFTLHRHGQPNRIFDLTGFKKLPVTQTRVPVYVERDEKTPDPDGA